MQNLIELFKKKTRSKDDFYLDKNIAIMIEEEFGSFDSLSNYAYKQGFILSIDCDDDYVFESI